MIIGKMSIPDDFGNKPFKWFKTWFDKAMSGNDETAEEVYVKLGGKLPESKKKEKSE